MLMLHCLQTFCVTSCYNIVLYRVVQNKPDYLTVRIVLFILRHPVVYEKSNNILLFCDYVINCRDAGIFTN